MLKDFVELRRKRLVEYINASGSADVAQLAKLTDVAEATIRRDLMELERAKLIHRTHGGAIRRERPALWQTTALQDRMGARLEVKERIAQCASQLINSGESLMVDGGSTTLLLARRLAEKGQLMVITNTSTIAEVLVENQSNHVLMTGGQLVNDTLAMVGPVAEQMLSQYRADKAIIGVSGILLGQGLFAAIPQEAQIKRLMIQNSRETIVVADSTKIGTRALALICNFERIGTLVTDKAIDKASRLSLEKAGITVLAV